MSESAYAARTEEFDELGDDGFEEEQLPGRPRRKLLNGWSALLLALLVGAAGFYVGVRVEKSSVTGSGAGSSSLARAFAARFGAGAGARSAASGNSASGSSSAASSATGASANAASGRAGAAAGGANGAALPGAGRFGAGATIGTISSVKGNTIYLRETNGNTVKVKLSSATQITKRQNVSKKKLYPGDTLVVQGASGSGATVSATSITDSGSSGSGSGSGSNSASSGGRSSVIGSLFGSG